MEAIQAAATGRARVMKLDKEVGTIEPGKRADLIIVDGNPLENISNNPQSEDCDRKRPDVRLRQALAKRGV